MTTQHFDNRASCSSLDSTSASYQEALLSCTRTSRPTRTRPLFEPRRPPERIENSQLDDIGRQEGFKGRGLLGRFLYSVPESLVGRRKIEPDPIPEHVMETYRRHVLDLTLFLDEWTDPAVIQLTLEAVATLTAFQARVEPMLEARGGIMGQIGDWGGKLVGATARMAALLHLAEHVTKGHTVPVAEATMRDAIALAEYFISHSLAAFDSMGADRIAERARTVLEALRIHGWRDVSKRDLMVKLSRSEFRTANDLDPVLALLEDHGYVRAQAVQRTGGRGRPPSPRYLVNPRLPDQTA